MLINAILAIILLAVLGSLANRIMCCGGNLLHNVLAGGCGILLSYVVRVSSLLQSWQSFGSW